MNRLGEAGGRLVRENRIHKGEIMPCDFENRKLYSIDYNDVLESNLEQCYKVFDQKSAAYIYVSRWIKLLKGYDKLAESEFKSLTPQQWQDVLYKLDEIFVQDVSFSKTKILVHFSVASIKALISNNEVENIKLNPIKMPIELFTKSDSIIRWNPVHIDKSMAFNSDPIVISIFIGPNKPYLVIDGNHRISIAIKEKRNYIVAYIFGSGIYINKRLFASTFDLCYYALHNELTFLNEYKQNNRISDKDLMKMSYLSNGKFNFTTGFGMGVTN